MIEKLLWTTGILGAIAILVRGSMAVGMYMGILPGIVLALGFAIVAPMALSGRAAFAAAVKGDGVPAQPVRIAGHVKLERLGRVAKDRANIATRAAKPADPERD